MGDSTVEQVVMEHRDRLMRFGAEHPGAALAARVGKLPVVDESERKADLVQDMISMLTSFCAQPPDRWSARHRALRAVAACAAEEPE